jgi:hypothetical protein
MASPAPRLFFFCFLLAGSLLYLFWPAEYDTQLEDFSKAATSRLSAAASSHPPSCRVYDNLSDPFTKEYGRTNLMLSRSYEGARRSGYGQNEAHAFLGSGVRVRRLLRKLQQGKSIKIAVIGGSVSAGHVGFLIIASSRMLT